MLKEFLDKILFTYENWNLTIGQVLLVLILLAAGVLGNRMARSRWKLRIYEGRDINQAERKRFTKYLKITIYLLITLGLIRILKLDYNFYESEDIILKLSHIFYALIFLYGARLLDWMLSNILIQKYYEEHKGEADQYYSQAGVASMAAKVVQYIVYILTTILILKNFNLDYTFFTSTYGEQSVDFNISKILIVVLIVLIARLIIWLITQIALYSAYKRKEVNKGAQFAINQLIKYVIYVMAFLFALHSLGINMTLLWGGAAALMVGVGLGLQQTFNDFFSGLVLLFERSVSVGDIVEMDGMVGTVRRIGLRASVVETRENMSIVVPNSKLVNENVNNWTHYDDKVRFHVNVGVAYGSDTLLVKNLLLKTAEENPYALEYPKPWVRFLDFGDSSLNFSIIFFSRNYLMIEDVKSDLRFEIDRLFRDNNISIPFPQRDIWIKGDLPGGIRIQSPDSDPKPGA